MNDRSASRAGSVKRRADPASLRRATLSQSWSVDEQEGRAREGTSNRALGVCYSVKLCKFVVGLIMLAPPLAKGLEQTER
jgi:hypothetical protein